MTDVQEKAPFAITPKAAEKITALLQAENLDPVTHGLRVGVVGGGCSGYSYKMEFTETRDGDQVVAHGPAQVFVDSKSLLFLGGSVLDYIESLTGAGFTVRNPNATGTCGCGTSFSV